MLNERTHFFIPLSLNQLSSICCWSFAFFLLIRNCAFALEDESFRYLRGVSPEETRFYQPPEFRCRDGTKIIPIAWVNDDYCDCKDGTDEPGTSACWNGHFYCANVGHIPQTIPSSRVNDGLCDCCDGSDEWLSSVTTQRERDSAASGMTGGVTTLQLPLPNAACANRCVEEHEHFLARHMKVLSEAEDGWRTRAEWIAAYEAQLTHSQQRIQLLQSELDTLNSRIQRLEEAQRDISREYDGVRERIKERILASELEKEDNSELNTTASQEPIDKTEQEDEMTNVENSSNKTTATEPLQNNSVEAQSSTTIVSDISSQETATSPASPPTDDTTSSSKPINELNDAEKNKREEEEKRIQEREERIRRLVDQHPDITRLQEEKSKLEEELQKTREARDKVKSELDELKTFVDLDLGPRGEYYGLYKKSLTFETKEYTYELLPFDKVLQKPKGTTTAYGTNMGRWEGWDEEYSVMKFSNGDSCWNRPNRSVRIDISCGRENQILEVKEPSKCSYTMRLQTPAKCDDEYLNKLKASLRS